MNCDLTQSNRSANRRSRKLILGILLAMTPWITMEAQEYNPEEEILKAYELRLSGKTQQAKSLLKGVLDRDSTNAMAHFEMARTKQHPHGWTNIDRAIHYDPENPMYIFYRANLFMLGAYMAMHEDDNAVASKRIKNCCNNLKNVLKIEPDCRESLLFLVDLYTNLPAELGGDRGEAEKYLEQLKSVDPLYAAQGKIFLAAEEINIVDFWKEYLNIHGESQDALVKLGKAHLLNNDTDNAAICFDKVIAGDPSRTILYLHVARAHLYNAMRGGPQEEITKLNEQILLYLESTEEKPVTIEAWCYGWLGTGAQKTGDKEKADEYLGKAKELMPNYSRATALPAIDGPPNVIAYHFSSYFSPF